MGSNDARLVALGGGWLVGWLVGCETSPLGKPCANDAQGADAECCKTPDKEPNLFHAGGSVCEETSCIRFELNLQGSMHFKILFLP